MRESRTLRAMWRALETGPRHLLNGHEEGNLGYKPRRCLRAAAPVLDPTDNALPCPTITCTQTGISAKLWWSRQNPSTCTSTANAARHASSSLGTATGAASLAGASRFKFCQGD